MTDQSDLICSARKCRAAAEYALVWRNPRIHDASRRKVWLACEEHGGFLHEYLASRGFPVEAMPVADLPAEAEAPVGQGRPGDATTASPRTADTREDHA